MITQISLSYLENSFDVQNILKDVSQQYFL
jgi:hypothetical protein